MRNTSKASTRPDPIFAAIAAHRAATATRYPIMEKLMGTPDGAAGHARLATKHDKALLVEVAATTKLRKIIPTTLPGVTALAAYFVEHQDRYFKSGDAGRRGTTKP